MEDDSPTPNAPSDPTKMARINGKNQEDVSGPCEQSVVLAEDVDHLKAVQDWIHVRLSRSDAQRHVTSMPGDGRPGHGGGPSPADGEHRPGQAP